MDKEQELRTLIQEAKAEYLDGVGIDSRAVSAGKAKIVNDLQNELTAFLASGVGPCEECGAMPMVMLKRTAESRKGIQYECGVGGCDKRKDVMCKAHGKTAQDAVQAWNDGGRLPRQ